MRIMKNILSLHLSDIDQARVVIWKMIEEWNELLMKRKSDEWVEGATESELEKLERQYVRRQKKNETAMEDPNRK